MHKRIILCLLLLLIMVGCSSSTNARDEESNKPEQLVVEIGENKPSSNDFEDGVFTEQLGFTEIDIPSSWLKSENGSYKSYYAENGPNNKLAFLYTINNADTVYEEANQIAYNKTYVNAVLEGFDSFEVLEQSELDINGIKVFNYQINGVVAGKEGLTYMFFYRDPTDKSLSTLMFFEGTDSSYSYKEDVNKILHSVRIVTEEEPENEELIKQIEEIEEAVSIAEKSSLRSDYDEAMSRINRIIEDPAYDDYIDGWQNRMEAVLTQIEENERKKEQEEIQTEVNKVESLLSKATSNPTQANYDGAKSAIDAIKDDPRFEQYISGWEDGLNSIKTKIDEDAKIVSYIVYPNPSSKLGKDYDSRSESTVYYFNVDGTKNKPSLKKWGSAVVTDGVYEYFETLESLGLDVTVTSTDSISPYSGFTQYESYFKASNTKISWTMYLAIQDELYVEYEFDIYSE